MSEIDKLKNNIACKENIINHLADTNIELQKQLKAKEQECEELKIYIESNEQQVKEVEKLVMDNDRLINELDQLKAENEILEKVNKNNQEKIKKLNEQLEEEFITQQYADMALFWKVEDYKQALSEIKEIVEQGVKIHDDIIVSKQILQKISEVIPNEN